MNLPDSLPELSSQLTHERDALVRISAALQLLPQNATKWVRLERLLEVASGVDPAREQRSPSRGRLRRLLTSPPIASTQVVQAEDPFEEPFTAEILFLGGSYRVVLGGAAGAHAGCQVFLEAVRGLPDDRYENFKLATFADATVLLTLSNAVCVRVGLDRWEEPTHSPDTDLRLPTVNELESLQRAVSFSETDLAGLLGPTEDWVDELVAPIPMGLVDHETESPTDDRTYLYPLMRLTDESTVLALPSGSAASLTHRGLARAVNQQMAQPLVAALHAAALRVCSTYLNRVRWKPVAPPPSLEAPALVGEAFYRFDVDKIAHLVTVVDSLEDYRAGQPFSMVAMADIEAEIHQRVTVVRAAAQRDMDAPHVMHLVCSASLGRSFSMGFPDHGPDEFSTVLSLTTDDLDILTRIEGPDPLGLWKFARASQRLRAKSHVFSFSTLDEYAIYHDNGNSFYLSDDKPPTAMNITVGSGGRLRVSERRRSDVHAVSLPEEGGIVQVSRWPNDDDTPIYRPEVSSYSDWHLVEIQAPCWVVPVPGTPEEREGSEDFAEVVAFWLWYCRDHIDPPLRNIALLQVHVRMVAQSVDIESETDLEPVSHWLNCEADPQSGIVRLTALDGALGRLRGPGNSAERLIAGALVEQVGQLVGEEGSNFTRSVADSLPSGPMKMSHVLSQEDDLLFALGYTPAPRLVPSADVEEVLDEVGDIATGELGLTEGLIPQAQRTRVLNDIVGELFARLKKTIAGLNSDGVLEALAAEQEALAFYEARRALLMPAQAACFGEESAAVNRAIETNKAHTSTSIALRFVIECATALPPTGSHQLTLGLYDRLIALSKQIVELGYLSDAIRYNLSHTELSVLPSGRLGSSRDEPYHQTVAAYMAIVSGRSLSGAQRGFPRHWAIVRDARTEFDSGDLDHAFQSEFGITATQLATLSGELMELARGERRQIGVQEREDLRSALTDRLELSEDCLTTGLQLLALGELQEFPPSANPIDSYPWRFSRERSALRRPLLCRPSRQESVEVVWGPRSVYRAGRYLLEQISSGRLKAESEEMQQYITSARQRANRVFNHEVAEIYRSRGWEDVQENISKLGKLRLTRANGEEIGDMDVLVLDHSQKVMLAVEVKDFEFARTPFELSNEIEKLVAGKHSASYRHEERLSFLRANIVRVVDELALQGSGAEWQVQGMIVTSSDLMAAHIPVVEKASKRLKILDYETLRSRDSSTLVVRSKVNPSTRADRRKKRKRRGR